jgi:putative transposase
LKQEKIYLIILTTIKEAKDAIKEYVKFYNNERMHQSLQYFTPAKAYYNNSNLMVGNCIS